MLIYYLPDIDVFSAKGATVTILTAGNVWLLELSEFNLLSKIIMPEGVVGVTRMGAEFESALIVVKNMRPIIRK